MRLSAHKRKKMLSFFFLLPALLLSLVFIVYPLLTTIKLSFQDVRMFNSNLSNAAFTTQNYTRLFANSQFWESLWKTLVFTFSGTAIAFVIGLFTAMLLNQKFKGRMFARAAIMFSWPTPAIAVSVVFAWMLNTDFGIVNQLLQINIPWLFSKDLAFVAILVAAVWKAFPFFTLMLLAGLQNISTELYEASAVDGANAVQQFFKITLPGLLSISVISILLNGVWFFKNFDIVYGLTGGGPSRSTELLSINLYIEAFKYFHTDTACAIGVISLVLCVLFICLAAPFMDKDFY